MTSICIQRVIFERFGAVCVLNPQMCLVARLAFSTARWMACRQNVVEEVMEVLVHSREARKAEARHAHEMSAPLQGRRRSMDHSTGPGDR